MLRCNCGFDARAGDENGLVAEVQRHARDAHGMALTPDEALVLVFRAELTAARTIARAVDPTDEEER